MPEKFERESEEIIKETEREYVSVEKARENTAKAVDDVSKLDNVTTRRVLEDSLKAQAEANSKLNRKAFETTSKKEFKDTEWDRFSEFVDKMRELPPIDYENPTPENVSTLYDLYNKSKTISPEINEAATNTTVNLAETTTTNTINNNTTSSEKNELKDAQDEVSTNSRKLKDLFDKGDQSPQGIKDVTEAIVEVQNSLNELKKKIENNPKLREKLISEGSIDYIIKFTFYAGLSGIAIFGFYMIGKMYADAMSGCYQYNGTNQRKIPKPNDNNNPQWCSCGPAGDTKYQPTQPDTVCSDDKFSNYPFCANGINPSEYPLCSPILGDKKPGEDGYIYYGYTIKTPSDLIPDLINDVKKGLEELTSGLSNILISILKWGGISLGVLLLIYIIYLVVNKTFASH
jgi:hypothetical protein